MSNYIEIKGEKYKVIETLPYHGMGMHAKMVQTDEGEKVAVKKGGLWVFRSASDKVAPLRSKFFG
jgi:hypothetical protein